MMMMTGAAKAMMGRIHLVMPTPDVNQITISESWCHRVSVSNTVRKMVSDMIIGRNLIRLNPSMVRIASFGIHPLAALPTKNPARCATTMPMRIKKSALAVKISSRDNDFLNIFNLYNAL